MTVPLDYGVALDFATADRPISPQHYAFLVSEEGPTRRDATSPAPGVVETFMTLTRGWKSVSEKLMDCFRSIGSAHYGRNSGACLMFPPM